MASPGGRVHAPLGDAGKILRCVIPAQAGIHLAPSFAYALWIPACAGMTHRRTTRRLSNIPALQFKMSDILTTLDAGIMTITLNRAGKKTRSRRRYMHPSMADALHCGLVYADDNASFLLTSRRRRMRLRRFWKNVNWISRGFSLALNVDPSVRQPTTSSAECAPIPRASLPWRSRCHSSLGRAATSHR